MCWTICFCVIAWASATHRFYWQPTAVMPGFLWQAFWHIQGSWRTLFTHTLPWGQNQVCAHTHTHTHYHNSLTSHVDYALIGCWTHAFKSAFQLGSCCWKLFHIVLGFTSTSLEVSAVPGQLPTVVSMCMSGGAAFWLAVLGKQHLKFTTKV